MTLLTSTDSILSKSIRKNESDNESNMYWHM